MISAEDLIEEKTLLCGSSALSFAGLIMFNTTHYTLQTSEELLHNSELYFITLKYNQTMAKGRSMAAAKRGRKIGRASCRERE